MTPKRTIVALTGTRADYGIYRPVFKEILAAKTLELSLIVTGMHLRKEFGHTIDAIRNDGYAIRAALDTLATENTPRATTEYVARTLAETARVLEHDRPDMLLVLGDRGEMLAGAIAAMELAVPVAHLHGGETSGTVDDAARRAITQMASVHMTSAERHSEAVARMRGSRHNVFTVGAPGLDAVRMLKPRSKQDLCRETGFDPSLPLAILVQHPDTLDGRSPDDQLRPTLEALGSFDGNIVIVGANADAGGITMNALLRDFAENDARRTFAPSLPHDDFLSWLAAADLLIGNSSSGIIEAASFHVPAVNVGDRQRGRLRSGNVIDTDYDRSAVAAAIDTALHDAAFRAAVRTCVNAYGDGHAATRIVRILAETPLRRER